jgi:hypothetical protein
MARGKGGSGRRYVRDNRGRFAAKGAGATARGGRLKTASGNKRATQTMKVAGSGSKIRKPMSSGSNKPAQQISSKRQVSSARQAATDRLKIKTATRRKLKTDRSSAMPDKPKARRVQGSRPASTVAKPRTKGNNPKTVARRVERKAAVNQANIKNIPQKERTGATQGRQYQRALKTQATLKRAQEFTKTGKLPGRDNSIKAQRERKAAGERLAAKRAARQRQAAAKPAAARTSKAPANKAKDAYKRAREEARMRNEDLRGADVNERRMANSASAKVKNMQRRRSTSAPKASAEAPRSKQKARELARIKRAYSNERRAYAAKGDGPGTAKQSRTASVAKRAQDIYSGKISASYKTTSRLTRTQNPDVLKARIKRGEKLTAARAKRAARQRGDVKTNRKPKPASVNLGKPAKVTSRGRTIKPAENFKPAVKGKSAPDNARTRANKLKTAQNKVRMYSETDSRSAQNAIANRNAALKARPQGTPGKVVFRSKNRASSRFQQRANDLTSRIKGDLKSSKLAGTFSATSGGGGKGIVRRNTGDKQTSMFGKPAPLYINKTVKSVKRRSGKRK